MDERPIPLFEPLAPRKYDKNKVKIDYDIIKGKLIHIEYKLSYYDGHCTLLYVDENLIVQRAIISKICNFGDSKVIITEDTNNYFQNKLLREFSEEEITADKFIHKYCRKLRQEFRCSQISDCFITEIHHITLELELVRNLVPGKHIDQLYDLMDTIYYKEPYIKPEGVSKDIHEHIASYRIKYDYRKSPESPKNKKIFDFIVAELHMTTDTTLDWIKTNKKELYRYIINDLKNKKGFIKYGIPVEYLKPDTMFFSTDKTLSVTFSLKITE